MDLFDIALKERFVSKAIFSRYDYKRKDLICFVGLPDIGKTRMLWEILPVVQRRLNELHALGEEAEKQGLLHVDNPAMLALYVAYQNGNRWCDYDAEAPSASLAWRIMHAYFNLHNFSAFVKDLSQQSTNTFKNLTILDALRLVRAHSGISHVVVLWDEFQCVRALDNRRFSDIFARVTEMHNVDQQCLWVLAGTDFSTLWRGCSDSRQPLNRIPLKFVSTNRQLFRASALAKHIGHLFAESSPCWPRFQVCLLDC